MSSYSELIKNFEKIRAYMRDFYVYGFKSRDDYQSKSARSYDDERRRLESWLGDHMSFVRTWRALGRPALLFTGEKASGILPEPLLLFAFSVFGAFSDAAFLPASLTSS